MATKKPTQPATKRVTSASKATPSSKPTARKSTSPSRPAAAKRSAGVPRPHITKSSGKPKSVPLAPIVPPTPVPPATLRPSSKQSQLLELLHTGTTMPQMVQLTGWQPHTIRATISAVFRKRLGLSIASTSTAGDATRQYRVTTASA